MEERLIGVDDASPLCNGHTIRNADESAMNPHPLRENAPGVGGCVCSVSKPQGRIVRHAGRLLGYSNPYIYPVVQARCLVLGGPQAHNHARNRLLHAL